MAGIFRVSVESAVYDFDQSTVLEVQGYLYVSLSGEVNPDSIIVVDVTGGSFGLDAAHVTASGTWLGSPTEIRTYYPGPISLNPSSGAYYLDWRGSSGSATLIAGDFADQLFGGDGADRLDGGAGNDQIAGGAGADTLIGGGGNDTFLGSISDVNGDSITDFSFGDKLVIVGADLSPLGSQNVTGSISLGLGQSLTLQGTFSGRYWSAAYDNGTGATTLQMHADPVITAPLSLDAQAGATLAVSGVVFADPDALETDLFTANFTTDHLFASASTPVGVTATTPAVGAPGTIQLIGTLAQLNQVVVRYTVVSGAGGLSPIQVTLDDQDAATPTSNVAINITLVQEVTDPVDPPTPSYPIVQNNPLGGHDITITDPAQLTASLGTSGVDHVFYAGSGTVTLPGTIENLTITAGNGAVVGNTLRNTLRGSTGNNTLKGQDGNDLVYGGSGNDRLSGGSGKDRLEGGSGHDFLFGGNGHDTILGGDGNDTISAGVGNDVIYSGLGADVIEDGGGRDIFVFNTRLGKGQIDKLKHFNVEPDTIWLENAIFKGVGGRGWLKADTFHIGSKAADKEDRIIYNAKKGMLYYDADGIGGKGQTAFAKLSKDLKMTEKDFFII